MATAPPPPPPLPPDTFKRSVTLNPTPTPQPAAMPYSSNEEDYPVQETTPFPEAQHGTQAAADPPLPSVQPQAEPQPLLIQGQADSPSGPEEKCHPVQETDPAPQTQNGPQANRLQVSGAAGAAGPQDEAAGQWKDMADGC